MNALKLRGTTFHIQTTNPQTGRQDSTSLRTKEKKVAIARKNRFLVTLEETGSWEAAKEELLGKKIVKKGQSPDFEQMKDLYRKYCDQSAKSVRPVTITTNVNALRRLMERCKAETVADITQDRLNVTGEEGKKVVREIKHAKGIFKAAALRFYEKQGVKVWNPFTGIELPTEEPKPYIPLSEEKRRAIWNEGKNLPADQALVILLGMGLGLRISEIDKARVDWFVKEGDHYIFTIKDEEDFKPKTHHSRRNIPVAASLVEEILETREKLNPSDFDPYILAGDGRGHYRKDKTYRATSEWLKVMGVEERNPNHSLRKEFASNVMKAHGGETAYKLIGHTDMNLFMKVYGGLVKPATIDMGAIIG